MITISINGQTANVRDIEKIGFRSVFEDQYNELELNVDSIVLVNESRDQIYDWVFGNNPGAWVGIPATISAGSISLDYYIDLTEDPKFRDRDVEVKIKRRYSKDSFFELMRGSSFELLASKGVVFPTMDLPYVIVHEDQVGQAITMYFTIFVMVETALRTAREIVSLAKDLGAAIADLNPATFIAVGLKIVAYSAYLVLVISALIDLIKGFKEMAFPNIRTMKVCKIKDLISVSAQHFGFTYTSTALDSFGDLVFIPVPLVKSKKSIFKFKPNEITDSFTKGYPSSSDTVQSPGVLIEAVETMINGKTQVSGGSARTERRDFWQSIPGIVKVPFLNVRETRQNEFTINTSDGWSRYFIHYLTDQSDINTLDNYEPTDAEYGSKNLNIIAPDLNLNRGLVEVPIPFALSNPKIEFTWLENLALVVLQKIDVLAGLNISSEIESRINVMQISQEFYTTSKIGIISNGKLKSDQSDILRASALWNKFHNINRIETNSYKIFEGAEIPMSLDEFEQIMQTNYMNMNGEISEILNISYVPYECKAVVKYRVRDDYSVGKMETTVVNA